MNEQTTTERQLIGQTGATVPQDVNPALSTDSGYWALQAQTIPNRDAYVPIKDLLFDKQSTLATVSEVEAGAMDAEGNGRTVKLAFTHEKELESIEGVKKSPGVWRPRFGYVIDAGPEGEPEQAERGIRDLGRILIGAGVLPVNRLPKAGEVVAALDNLKGRRVHMRFVVTEGKKRDPESGERQKFQNVYFAAPSEGTAKEAKAAGAKMDDY